MYSLFATPRFKRAVKKVKKLSFFKKEELAEVLLLLQQGRKLSPNHKDHALHGILAGFRDCYVQNDIVLIYAVNTELRVIELYDIGTHSEIFS